jgi:Cu/Ag efflux protein CusF
MDAAGKIKLADKEVKLDELKKGDQVEIKYEKDGDKLIAKEITVKRE